MKNESLTKLAQAFEATGHSLFMVGGCVRDELIGAAPNDIDFATSARPDEISSILSSAGLKVIPIGIDFGTIQTIIEDEKVEITTFRCKESYTKGSRKPSVVFGDNIKGDLERRDFTINAIACRVGAGSVVDPFGGVDDLRNGIIRTPSDPSIAFSDDPLRMLRAARFVSRGFGKLHDDTFEAIKKHGDLVAGLSAERIFEELTKLLMTDNPVAGLRILEETGILVKIFPEFQAMLSFTEDVGKWHHLSIWEHTLETVGGSKKVPEVRWAALFHDIAKPSCWSKKGKDVHFYQHDRVGSGMWTGIAGRLKCSTKFSKHVETLIYEHQSLNNQMGTRGMRRLVHRLGDCLDNLFFLSEADIKAHVPRIVEPKLKELFELRSRVDDVLNATNSVSAKMPRGTGNLICDALNIKPGPQLGVIMKTLQGMLVDGDLNAQSDFVAEAKKIKHK